MSSLVLRGLGLGLLPLAALVTGCEAEGWHPPPPSGTTYLYEYQGFKERSRGGFGGIVAVAPRMGIAYGGAFNFRQSQGLTGEAEKDPYAESTPIDGLRFNTHLGPRGAPLAARVAAAPAGALSAAPPAPPLPPAALPGSLAPAAAPAPSAARPPAPAGAR